jgi:hypothetical protein
LNPTPAHFVRTAIGRISEESESTQAAVVGDAALRGDYDLFNEAEVRE